MKMDYRRWTVAASAGAALIAIGIGYAQGNTASALAFLVILGVILSGILWLTRPRAGDRHLSHAAAQAAAGDRDVILYWRPG